MNLVYRTHRAFDGYRPDMEHFRDTIYPVTNRHADGVMPCPGLRFKSERSRLTSHCTYGVLNCG
jgi:hypothetical protein